MLTDERRAEIRQRYANGGERSEVTFDDVLVIESRLSDLVIDDVFKLVEEVDRLRARLAAAEAVCEAWRDCVGQSLVYQKWVALCRQQETTDAE